MKDINVIKLETIVQFNFHLDKGEIIYMPLGDADSWIRPIKGDDINVSIISQGHCYGPSEELIGPKDSLIPLIERLMFIGQEFYVVPDSKLESVKFNFFQKMIGRVYHFFKK